MVNLETGLAVLRVIFRHNIDTPIKAVTVKELTTICEREVAAIVSIAVQHGVPIGSTSGGYFHWRSEAEREIYINREKSRVKSLGRKLSQIIKQRNNTLSLFEQESESNVDINTSNSQVKPT